MLSVCQVVASINRDTGGPAVTVPSLAQSLANQGVASTLVTLDYADLGPQADCSGVELVTLPTGWLTRRARGWNRSLQSRLRERAANADLVHSHGLWMFPNMYARQAAVRANIPLVISPRGMLDEWSLGRSRLKKFFAWQLFECANLRTAALLHATSEAEAVCFRNLGLRQPIAVIPNGIEISNLQTRPDRNILEGKYAGLRGCRWLLFLSRIHPKKGVAELLAAWRELEQSFPDWHLILAGPDLDGYGRVAREKAMTDGLTHRLTFTGALAGVEKECALANADAFILPTHSESFGVVIAEALSFGLPVITTKNAPWSELETHRCGWWIDLQIPVLARCLEAALTTPKPELKEMGMRGRNLVADKFSWHRLGEEMKQCYEWLLDRGPKPSCVQVSSEPALEPT